eukprot:2843514-Rhodomonas_salina.1
MHALVDHVPYFVENVISGFKDDPIAVRLAPLSFGVGVVDEEEEEFLFLFLLARSSLVAFYLLSFRLC